MRLRYTLCLATILSFILAWSAPPFAGPDEGAHMAYVAALANGHMPQLGSMQQADIETGVTFQAQHPPLFYAVAAPLFRVFSPNLALVNRVIRLLCVASFVLTIFFAYKLTYLLNENRNSSWPAIAAFLMAANPHFLLVSSFVNNDGPAIMLGTACLCFAAKFACSPNSETTLRRFRWLLIAALAGGLALFTKFTALSLVFGAAILVGHNATRFEKVWHCGLLFFISLLFVVPWLLYMKNTFGTLAPQQFHPVFTGGWREAVEQPNVAIYAAYMVWGELCLGLFLPLWQTHTLFGDFPLYFYFEWFLGLVSGILICWLAWRERQRWIVAILLSLWILILSQALFRDREAILFASRYGPTAAGAVAIVIASIIARQSEKITKFIVATWLCVATGIYIFIFSFLVRGH